MSVTTGVRSSSTASLHRVLVGVRRRAGRRAAAVEHEHVEAAVGAHRGLDRAQKVGALANVAGHGGRAQPLRLLAQQLLAAREHHDVRALLAQRLGARQPESRGGAQHERGAPAQPEIHRYRLATR